MRRPLSLLVLVILALSLAGCDESPPASKEKKKASQPTSFLKLALLKSGKATIDGAIVSPSEMRAKFKKLAAEKGVVLYYQELTDGDGSSEAMPVMQALLDARAPVRTSKKADFSDVLGPDGKLLPNDSDE